MGAAQAMEGFRARGVYHDLGLRRKHLQAGYLDEFVFRFNRRNNRASHR